MKLPARVLIVVILATFGINATRTATRPCKLYVPPRRFVDQGCINQGQDRRYAAFVVCGLQKRLSWKSDEKPDLHQLGNSDSTHINFAWPPYVVINSPDGHGNWRMARLGFRYDRNWRGYIFPTAACKCIDKPLQY